MFILFCAGRVIMRDLRAVEFVTKSDKIIERNTMNISIAMINFTCYRDDYGMFNGSLDYLCLITLKCFMNYLWRKFYSFYNPRWSALRSHRINVARRQATWSCRFLRVSNFSVHDSTAATWVQRRQCHSALVCVADFR